jgi:hypothetical protein
MVPISLFANLMLIKIVLSVIAFSNLQVKCAPRGQHRDRLFRSLLFSGTHRYANRAWCSNFSCNDVVPLGLFALAVPITAQLSASVPLDVKYISRSSAPINLATLALACLISDFALSPKPYMLDGFPNFSVNMAASHLKLLFLQEWLLHSLNIPDAYDALLSA